MNNCRQNQRDEIYNNNYINNSQKKYDDNSGYFEYYNNSDAPQSYNSNQNNKYINDQNISSPNNYQRLQSRNQWNDSYRNSDYEVNDNNNDNKNINNRRSRDIDTNNNNMNQRFQKYQDKPDDQLKKRFRTYIAEIISEQQLPKEMNMRQTRLQIEGVPAQYQCGLVTYNNTSIEDNVHLRPTAYMVETIYISDNKHIQRQII